MSPDELEAEFEAKRVSYSGSLLLLRAEDAITLVRRAAESQIGILGIDGMFVTPGETLSPIEHLVDFSTAYGRARGCWAEAERFIEQRRDTGLVFEVVLGRHLDYAV